MTIRNLFFAFFAALLAAVPVSAQEGYRIKPGDVLRIEVLEDSSLNRNALVLPDGSISVPLVGTVPAGGRTLNDVRSSLSTALAPNFAAAPTVFVGVDTLSAPRATGGGKATMSIYMMGEAAKPGRYEIERGSTFLQALAATGGLSKFAARKRLQLHRGSKVYVINYDAIERGATAGNSVVLTEGDVIVIPQRRLFE